MVPAEREQLIESLLSGTLDTHGKQRLEDLARHDAEVQDLMAQQEVMTRGLHTDRTAALKDLEQMQLRDQVAAFSRSVAGQSPGIMASSVLRWGASLMVAAGLVGGFLWLNDDAGDVGEQPVPAVQVQTETPQEGTVPTAESNARSESDPAQSAAETEVNAPSAAVPATNASPQHTENPLPSEELSGAAQEGTEADLPQETESGTDADPKDSVQIKENNIEGRGIIEFKHLD